MMGLQSYLEKNGLSMAVFEKETLLHEANFNSGLPDQANFIIGRDDFGLPIFMNSDAKVVVDVGSSGANNQRGFEKSSEKEARISSSVEENFVQSIAAEDGRLKGQVKAYKSWSQVVKNAPILGNGLLLDFIPLPAGKKVIYPCRCIEEMQ